MPASMRLELFTTDLPRSLHLYIDTLKFRVRTRKDNYVFMQRDDIFLAVIGVPIRENDDERRQEDKDAYRGRPRDVEIVFEVDDLTAERDRVVGMGWPLEADVALQPWGLWDFRIEDPDGYCECCFVSSLSLFLGPLVGASERSWQFLGNERGGVAGASAADGFASRFALHDAQPGAGWVGGLRCLVVDEISGKSVIQGDICGAGVEVSRDRNRNRC